MDGCMMGSDGSLYSKEVEDRPNAQETVSHKTTAELHQLLTSSVAGLHLSEVNITVKYHIFDVFL